jgi:hypothetical protein
MEHNKKVKKNTSVKFTEFMMKKEEAPYEMEIVVRKNRNHQP